MCDHRAEELSLSSAVGAEEPASLHSGRDLDAVVFVFPLHNSSAWVFAPSLAVGVAPTRSDFSDKSPIGSDNDLDMQVVSIDLPFCNSGILSLPSCQATVGPSQAVGTKKASRATRPAVLRSMSPPTTFIRGIRPSVRQRISPAASP